MTQGPESSRQETFRIDGSDLMDKAKQLVDQGNKHRVVVLNEDGKSVFDIPLTVAVVGGIIVFPATAVGVIAALATRHSIVVESPGEPAPSNGSSVASDVASAEPREASGTARYGETAVPAPNPSDGPDDFKG